MIDLKLIFEHGLSFESSGDHAGLQLVDAVAHIVRRGVLDPENEALQQAYDAFRHKLLNKDGRCLTIHRLRAGEEDRSSLERYRPLHAATRAT